MHFWTQLFIINYNLKTRIIKKGSDSIKLHLLINIKPYSYYNIVKDKIRIFIITSIQHYTFLIHVYNDLNVFI